MEHYRNLVENLHHQTGHYALKDGFESEKLRRMILSRIKGLNIPEKPPEKTARFQPAGETERRRTAYFQLVRDISGRTAADWMRQELRAQTPEFLRHLIVSGADSIGREIGGEYAGSLYPELRRLQIAGLEIETEPKARSTTQRQNYGFTVLNYSNCLEISPVEICAEPPGRELFYDGINDRFIERFVFASVEEADTMRNAWEIHQKNPDRNPPVAYSFTIERDEEENVPEINSVEHTDPFARSEEKTLGNGIRQEIRVFNNVHQAFAERQKCLKEIQEQNLVPRPEKTLPKKALAEQRPRTKGKTVPAKQKTGMGNPESRRMTPQNRRPI